MRVKCLAQEHNTMTRLGLEPGPLDPESSALTTRPTRVSVCKCNFFLLSNKNKFLQRNVCCHYTSLTKVSQGQGQLSFHQISTNVLHV